MLAIYRLNCKTFVKCNLTSCTRRYDQWNTFFLALL